MRYWIDAEFIERGHRHPIDLISIAVVAEDDREYYAISTEFNPNHASQWVKDNVLDKLPPRHPINPMSGGVSPRLWGESKAWKSREVISIEVMAFLKDLPIVDLHHFERSRLAKLSARIFGTDGLAKHPSPKIQDIFNDPSFGEEPELWAYYGSYDHVSHCQLYGTMMDLPKGLPMYINDIMQEWRRLGKPELPQQASTAHNALDDARYCKQLWEFLDAYSKRDD
ncbi:3'-5' exoribonuclease [Phormidium sp. FACHB-592]|uniref:3'-5' exoribonuclease n=1 Tax=Stenomitos frigidus AS-A4 TaxID=2933935 RepID=A0ABV0KEM3_9CYAN|nr:3'-5' exoribonuclease [Phormidium sp. FACHB-592]MBD2076279.1 3'-5' exoribonuclease [Phormidium sp. FACHB-592]